MIASNVYKGEEKTSKNDMKEEGKMLVDRYQAEDVFARVPQMAERIDLVLKELDRLLEDDALYRQGRADFGKRHRYTLGHGGHSTPVGGVARIVIGQHLPQWRYQETQEKGGQNIRP